MTKHQIAKWRLILSPPARGSWNMAVDEAILTHMSIGDSQPTLRIYAWEPACLSIGYAQPYSDVSLPTLIMYDWNLVRRPTGGKAILHINELTYAVIGPSDDPILSGSVLESYKRLSGALLHALKQLGAPAQSAEIIRSNNDEQTQNPVCFEVPSNYEITVNGKKLIGSAQARRREGVLQHGSLPLYGDITKITKVLSLKNDKTRSEASQRLLSRATTLESVLGELITWEKAAQEFIIAFQQVLNIDFEPGELSSSEQAQATELEKNKYANPEWTQRI
jgi:lipoate-protein ligase A